MTTIIIKTNDSIFFPDKLDERNISVHRMFRDMGAAVDFFRRCLLRIGISVPSLFYNSALKNIDADVFIIQDADTQIHFLKWMHKIHPKTRMILWYWNTVEEMKRSLNPTDIPDYIEKWSYSQNDCSRYDMNYNTTFYIKPDLDFPVDHMLEKDVFFVGKDKGRMNRLIDIRDQLESRGLSTLFHICATRSRDLDRTGYSRRLTYDEIVQRIINCKAILDCVVEQEAGPTIRPMEALFWKKKLITDNMNIIYEDYYDPENIFVLGRDDLDDIADFVNSKYHENDYCSQYDIKAWADRFYLEAELE